jgi:hypothetical protein
MAFWKRKDSRADRADQVVGAGRRAPSQKKMIRDAHRAMNDAGLADYRQRAATIQDEADRALSRLEANGWQPAPMQKMLDDKRVERAAWHVCDASIRFGDGTSVTTSFYLLSTGAIRGTGRGGGVHEQAQQAVIDGLRRLGS